MEILCIMAEVEANNYEAIYWQRMSYNEQISALTAFDLFIGNKTRRISVCAIGVADEKQLV